MRGGGVCYIIKTIYYILRQWIDFVLSVGGELYRRLSIGVSSTAQLDAVQGLIIKNTSRSNTGLLIALTARIVELWLQ